VVGHKTALFAHVAKLGREAYDARAGPPTVQWVLVMSETVII